MLKNEDVVDFFFFVYFNILLQLHITTNKCLLKQTCKSIKRKHFPHLDL